MKILDVIACSASIAALLPGVALGAPKDAKPLHSLASAQNPEPNWKEEPVPGWAPSSNEEDVPPEDEPTYVEVSMHKLPVKINIRSILTKYPIF
jgi:hypothetical protein